MPRWEKHSFTNKKITKANLEKLLSKFKLKPRTGLFFPPSVVYPLIEQLKKFNLKLSDKALNSNQIYCLNRLLSDYEMGLLGDRSHEMDEVVEKLRQSKTLNFNKKDVDSSNPFEQLAISEDKIVEEITSLKEKVNQLPLSADDKKILNKSFFPGIIFLIENEKKVFKEIKQKIYLYTFNEDLVLHIDHPKFNTFKGFKETIYGLMNSLFCGAKIASDLNILPQYCEKLCLGLCLEGKIGDAFDWVIHKEKLPTFEELVNSYLNKEYFPSMQLFVDNELDIDDSIETLCEYILQRHDKEECILDETFAPLGKITEEGLIRYLECQHYCHRTTNVVCE